MAQIEGRAGTGMSGYRFYRALCEGPHEWEVVGHLLRCTVCGTQQPAPCTCGEGTIIHYRDCPVRKE